MDYKILIIASRAQGIAVTVLAYPTQELADKAFNLLADRWQFCYLEARKLY